MPSTFQVMLLFVLIAGAVTTALEGDADKALSLTKSLGMGFANGVGGSSPSPINRAQNQVRQLQKNVVRQEKKCAKLSETWTADDRKIVNCMHGLSWAKIQLSNAMQTHCEAIRKFHPTMYDTDCRKEARQFQRSFQAWAQKVEFDRAKSRCDVLGEKYTIDDYRMIDCHGSLWLLMQQRHSVASRDCKRTNDVAACTTADVQWTADKEWKATLNAKVAVQKCQTLRFFYTDDDPKVVACANKLKTFGLSVPADE